MLMYGGYKHFFKKKGENTKYYMKKLIIFFVAIIAVFGICASKTTRVTEKVIYELLDNKYSYTVGENSLVTNVTNDIILQVEVELEDEFEKEYQEEVDLCEKENRSSIKSFYNNKNNQLFNTLNIHAYKSYYISNYTPYIEFVYDKDIFNLNKTTILNNLEKNDKVKSVYIKESKNSQQEQLVGSLQMARAYYDVYETRTYTGEGVVVGILETGIINVNDSNLINTTCYTYDEAGYTEEITDHSTLMASFIAGENGIAPDATILSAKYNGTPNAEIDWMLDNGVDVINMSFGEENPTGVYGFDSAYMDYIVKQYGVIIVASVGNNGRESALISNPALGYNVISLGSGGGSITRHQFSACLVEEGPIKPTICVDGGSVRAPDGSNFYTGTSISAAITTGVLALIFEKYPTLKGSPERIMSLISSSSTHNPGYYYPFFANGGDLGVGFGMLNFDNFIEHRTNLNTIMNINGRTGVYIFTEDIELEAGTTFKASVAWTAYATGNVSQTKYTNYDLVLEDSNGNIVVQANSTNSVIETIVYEVPTSGSYKLRIKQIGAIKKINERLAYSYGEAALHE